MSFTPLNPSKIFDQYLNNIRPMVGVMPLRGTSAGRFAGGQNHQTPNPPPTPHALCKVEAADPKVWATPALVRCTRCGLRTY